MNALQIAEMLSTGALKAVELPATGWVRIDPAVLGNPPTPDVSVWRAHGNEEVDFIVVVSPGSDPVAIMTSKDLSKRSPLPPMVAALALTLATASEHPKNVPQEDPLDDDKKRIAFQLGDTLRQAIQESSLGQEMALGVCLTVGVVGITEALKLPKSKIYSLVASTLSELGHPYQDCDENRCLEADSVLAILAGVNKTHAVAAMLDVMAELLAPPDSQMEMAFSVIRAKVEAKRKQRLSVN